MSVTARDGIALVSSLLILVIVAGLGASSMWLATMNARTTENVRSQAIAKNASQTAMDLSRLALQSHYRDSGAFPEEGNFTVPSLKLAGSEGAQAVYELVSYTLMTEDDRVELEIQGSGPNGARHTTSARLIAEVDVAEGAPSGGDEMIPGLFSETAVHLAGGSPRLRDMPVHGNERVTMGRPTFQTCRDERDESGDCEDGFVTEFFSDPTAPEYPISTANGSNCDVGGVNDQRCRDGGTQEVHVAYEERLSLAAEGALRHGSVDMNSDSCDRVDTRCYTGDVTFSSPDDIPSGVTRIIADGDVAILSSGGGGGDGGGGPPAGKGPPGRGGGGSSDDDEDDEADLEGVTLISTGGGVQLPDRFSIKDTAIFSHDSLDFKKDFSAYGKVTIASKGATVLDEENGGDADEGDGCADPLRGVHFRGQSPALQDGDVTLLVVSEECIKISGMPFADIRGYFVSGAGAHLAGAPHSSFFGGIASKGDVKIAGTPNTSWDSGVELDSDYEVAPPTTDYTDAVVSFVTLR
ncbi:MAG: hypothetical protein U5K81_06985 [Trueperaceae bacterium]|nr:hypothetical protein [Trueperaceae bacterium]